jgi:hypothetical protein
LFQSEKPPPGEGELTREIYRRAQQVWPDAVLTKESFVLCASNLAYQLLDMDDDKSWRVIQDVWVEMLCFSASRCRGYLHAKSLRSGGEYLSYVWLLLSHLVMETVAERQQRSDARKHAISRFLVPSTRSETDGSGHLTRRFHQYIQEEEGAVRVHIPEEEEPATTSHDPRATVLVCAYD